MTVAAYAGDTGALVYIAENLGYFKDSGLDVTINDENFLFPLRDG